MDDFANYTLQVTTLALAPTEASDVVTCQMGTFNSFTGNIGLLHKNNRCFLTARVGFRSEWTPVLFFIYKVQ